MNYKIREATSVLDQLNALLKASFHQSENGNDIEYPGRHIKLLWDGPNMKITNFDDANQFVKRQYREGWSLGV